MWVKPSELMRRVMSDSLRSWGLQLASHVQARDRKAWPSTKSTLSN